MHGLLDKLDTIRYNESKEAVFMKPCRKCLKVKPPKEFYRDKQFKGGRAATCKECRNLKTGEWRKKNREFYNASMRAYFATYKDKRRDIDLKRKYGSSLEEYNHLLAEQDDKCGICGKLNKSKKRCFAMDHDHKTGKRRGILCFGCNRILHLLEKDGLLAKAQTYLIKHT